MEELHRELLKKRRSYLLENIIMEEGLLSTSKDKGLFTATMVFAIMREKDAESQLNKMLEMLPKRGPMAYSLFMEVLSVDYPWVVENFKEKEEELRQRSKLEVQPELKRTIKDYVRELAKTTRINQAQQRAIEDFLCRHIVADLNMTVSPKVHVNKLYVLHKMLMASIPVSSLDESDQADLKDVSPEAVTLDKIEREITLLTDRMSDMQATMDSCYDKLGETNKEMDLPDLVFSLRKMNLEREIRIEGLKNQMGEASRQVRLSRDKMRKAMDATSKQEEEKEELTKSLDILKTKIQKLQEDRQRMGMKQPFEGLAPGTPRMRSSRSQPIVRKKDSI